jgi:hypothetical protein
MFNKKFLTVMAALLGVSLFLVGCETEVEVPGSSNLIHFDETVGTIGDLTNALLEEGPLTIAVADNGTGIELTAPLVIPEDKTVYLLTELKTGTSCGLTVEGIVYAGAGGKLTTTTATAGIAVPATGRVYVQKGGTISTDAWNAVSDGSTGSAFEAGRVSLVEGGTLSYGGALLAPDGLEAALKYFSAGTLVVTAATNTGTPLAIIGAVNNGGVNSSKWVKITAGDNAGADALVVPVGLDLTAKGSDAFATVASLDVRGILTLDPAATLNAAQTVVVSGTLDLGANNALTLAGLTAGEFKTSGGVVKSAIATGSQAYLKVLLGAAGNPLNLEHSTAITLGTTGMTVKDGTTLTLTGGTLTADNTATANLTVNGTVVLDGGSIATGTTALADTNYAIQISGNTGRIVAGGVVISGAGALYEATGGAALAITISKAGGVVGTTAGINTLKGATTINAGSGKVILSVDGGTATGVFTSAAGGSYLAVKGDTVSLDGGTASATALTISVSGSLAVNSGGIIAIKTDTTKILSSGSSSTEKFSIASGAVLEVNGDATGATATFTKTTSAFANTGTFVSASLGNFVGNSGDTSWN